MGAAVVTGSLFGAAIDVVIGELPQLTGTKMTGSNPLQELWSWLGTLRDSSLVTVLAGTVALVVVFGVRKCSTWLQRPSPSPSVMLQRPGRPCQG